MLFNFLDDYPVSSVEVGKPFFADETAIFVKIGHLVDELLVILDG